MIRLISAASEAVRATLCAAVLVGGIGAGGIGHAQEDPMQAVVEQAAVLDAAPRLDEGVHAFSAEAMAEAAFAWITVEEPGFYTLTSSVPGALVLGSFPTANGAFDGTVKPEQYASSTSLDQPTKIGPILLDTSHPYLVSISGPAAGTLTVERTGPFPTPASTPEADTAFGPGEAAWRAAEKITLTLPASSEPRTVEVFAEPRADLDARVGSMRVRAGGTYPWAHDEAVTLGITATVPDGTPPALVYARVAPAPADLDETEPNEAEPDRLEIGTPFRGVLLANRDEDRLGFSVAEPADLALSVALTSARQRFTATLVDVTDGDEQVLWQRDPAGGSLESAALSLAAGDYELRLVRTDGRDEAAPYTIRLSAGAPTQANREVEPNDRPAAAMPLPDSLRVSGSATPDDDDVYLLSVPVDKAQHLWRVFTVDATRIRLHDEDGQIADVRASGRRTTVDALALTPGEYWVTVNAEGDYLLRVMDLGPRPEDYEGEPNDNVTDGQRLEFGQRIRGGFHREGDLDYYLFRLDTASPVEIGIRPASDGRMDVKLFRDNHQVGQRIAFNPGDGPYTFESTLPAGDWAMAVRALDSTIQESYELGVTRLAALASSEPDDQPEQAAKLPRDGDIAGTVGAFDGADQVFVPLPEGEGTAAMLCTREGEASPGRWRIYHWSDDSRVADVGRGGIAVFGYGPALGGAVRFGLDGTEFKIGYDCALRFPPLGDPPAPRPSPVPGEALAPLAPGETLRATIEAEGDEPKIPLALAEGTPAFIGCRDGDGAALPPDTRVWQLTGVDTPSRDLLEGLLPVVAGDAPMLELNRYYAGRHTGDALPLTVDCTLYGVDDLPRPSDMGPPAEFRIVRTGEDGGAAVENAPPPPGLEALIGREPPQRQPEGDLPVAITPATMPGLAAFNEAGQRFEVTASLVSEADAALPVTVTIGVTGEGWRVTTPEHSLTLAPGTPAEVATEVVAPPWLSPSLSPSLTVRVQAEDSFAASLSDIPVSPTALPVGPFTYWHAPDALRGGLNVLHYGLGARLIDWGGETPDEGLQQGESGLHDGLAPHVSGINVPMDIAFRLAARAEVAGVMIQLRSTTGPERWPASVEVYAPDSGEAGWRRIASAALPAVHAPQYLVFDAPVETDRLRFVFPRCNEPCNQAFLQEIQAIAVPGSHPDGLPPINAADLELGGHVVWANHNFGGAWSQQLLIAEAERSNGGWPRKNDRVPVLQATLGFHHNRAALIESVVWVGDPDDTERIPGAKVEASLVGPAGPWTPLGELPAPPIGEDRATLDLAEPRWARYLRFTFEPAPDRVLYGPDGIEVIEARGTSVLSLWEDDQPRAAYEAAMNAEPVAPVPPAGGPDRDSAVPLPMDETVASSVVIERNEDWWRITVPDGPPNRLALDFERTRPVVVSELQRADGTSVALEQGAGEGDLEAVLAPGEYRLRIYEPPRSVVITWDTSGSVGKYIPRTLAAVRTWGRSLKPGRDALQLLPFGPKGFLLDDFAETPEVLEEGLRKMEVTESSDSELAMKMASEALADRTGARGIVVMTDAETGPNEELWPALLDAMPRVVALSVDSDSRQNAAIMMDWAALNGGRFVRVIGPLGLADSMEMANALFRAPKAYTLTATLEELVESEGEATLTVNVSDGAPAATGAVELILDASGSMLQRMEGRRRIDIAHEALTGLVRETLPEGTPFAFRAFGLEEDACRTELIVPMGPLDKESAAQAIAGVPAINLARTAIADSLRAAGADLAEAEPPRVIVLVTDGEETCEGDPEAAIEEMRAAGIDARVNIVGFAIDDAELAETFAAWADAGGGTYFDAAGADALEQSIADALKPRFDIVRTYLTGETEVVGRIALGETLTVPAGRLTVTPGSGATGEAVTLEVAPNASVAVDYTPGTGLDTPTPPE